VWFFRDITESKQTDEKLRESKELLQLFIENAPASLAMLDREMRYLAVSRRYLDEVSLVGREIIGHSLYEILPDFPECWKETHRRGLAGEAIQAKEDFHVRSDGSVHWIRRGSHPWYTGNGAVGGIVIFFEDITERKRTEQQLQEAYNTVESLAVTDALTGLANRRHFDQYLTTEWRRSMRVHAPLSLLMIDADFFKLYNDTYGHPRGDNGLKQIAEAIQDVVSRPGDLIARFGGEEFVVVLPSTENEGALQLAREVCESMSKRGLPHSASPFGIVTISVGCATMVPSLGQHAMSLVESADSALYKAKHSGRNQACNANTM
jgi:diguanylate cyclase (GGDEF)-like protein/PAS domain S-box-containing protein